VGRLLLHLYGIADEAALHMSDQICSALQLINFWQDLSIDIPRERYYLPQTDCNAHQVSRQQLQALDQTRTATELIATQVRQAKALMLSGQSLVHRIPGRAGWELRLVVQGGLRIVEKIEDIGYATLKQRPQLGKRDLPRMIWRSWRM
jgi:phytoene/squalene synthetase